MSTKYSKVRNRPIFRSSNQPLLTFAINRTTARTLGIDIPQTLLALAGVID
jgi:hypothetical protein